MAGGGAREQGTAATAAATTVFRFFLFRKSSGGWAKSKAWDHHNSTPDLCRVSISLGCGTQPYCRGIRQRKYVDPPRSSRSSYQAAEAAAAAGGE